MTGAAVRLGSVQALSLRPAGAHAPLRVASVRALAASGLAGDRHADPCSPRQLLLAGSAAYEELALAPHTLRENLLLDVDTAQLVSGLVLQVGAEVRLRMMFQCEACGRLDRSGARLAGRIGKRRGMLARVLAGGDMREGDVVHALGVLAPAWPEDWRERVRRVIEAVPAGAVVEYRHLARLAGIQSSYCRAFPRLLAGFGAGYAAKAVASASPVSLPRWRGEGLFEHF